jgi:hypothetical protein
MKGMSRLLTAALVVGVGLLLAGPALADSDTGGGTVEILAAVTVTNTADMDFGEIVAPTSGNQDFVMAAATGAVTPGAGDGEAYGSPAAASFTITGDGSHAITSNAVVTTDFTDASLTLGSLTTAGDTATIPGGGTGTITVGGTLNVTSGISTGTYNDAVITLTVNYQ